MARLPVQVPPVHTYPLAHSVDTEHVVRHVPLAQPNGEQLADPDAWQSPAPSQICPATESPLQTAPPQLVPLEV